MMTFLTKWKDSKNLFKYLLIAFVLIVAILEGTRRFIHNITTKLGWWMFFTGVVMTTVFFTLSMYYETSFMDKLVQLIEWLHNFIGGL